MDKKVSNVIQFPDRTENIIDTDEELDFWGDVYIAARVQERSSVTFDEFLKNPHRHLAACDQEDALSMLSVGFLPLLPKQEAAIHSLHKQWDKQNRRERVDVKHPVFSNDLIPGWQFD